MPSSDTNHPSKKALTKGPSMNHPSSESEKKLEKKMLAGTSTNAQPLMGSGAPNSSSQTEDIFIGCGLLIVLGSIGFFAWSKRSSLLSAIDRQLGKVSSMAAPKPSSPSTDADEVLADTSK